MADLPPEQWRPRWFHRPTPLTETGEQGPIQVVTRMRRGQFHTLPMPILEQAWKEYDAQGHGDQSLRRLNERGGFGLLEVVCLLADRCERLERRRG